MSLRAEAEAAGKAARSRGDGLGACPESYALPLRRAFEKGWNGSGAAVEAPDVGPAPVIEPTFERRWPDGVPLPEALVRHLVPCFRCRLQVMADGRRACAQTSGGDGTAAHFACRACGHEFKLRVQFE